MKKCSLTVFLILTVFYSFSQVPINFLARSEDSIKVYMKVYGNCQYEKAYSDVGVPYLKTLITDFKISNQKNVYGTSMYAAFFVLGLNNNCSQCRYLFTNSNDLERIVNTMNNDKLFIKNPDSFGWKHIDFPIAVNILKKAGSEGFTFEYLWLPNK